jgi:CheY-like chemotaxis protein
VHDFGAGIDESIRKKVFLPFFSTKSDRDAGMGLAIAHSIAVRHGGAVNFECDPDEGTTFTVRFDRASAADDTSKIVQRQDQREQLRVLAVDDDPQILDVLRDMLSLDGHEVTVAQDGPKAVEILRDKVFDILITDLGMPGMSGLDLAGLAHETQPNLAIAMVTGWGTQLNSEEIALRGVRNVLAKPFHLKDIRALIEELAPPVQQA